ncbi:MAG: hypothetical protein WA160_15920 [Pseudobdellovibrio sp.]
MELIVSTYDAKGVSIYPLPPTFVEASWNSSGIDAGKTIWDFTKSLISNLGNYPDLREVYVRTLKLSDGRTFTTDGDYDTTNFLFRLKLPKTVTSPITITIKDVSENETKLMLNIL